MLGSFGSLLSAVSVGAILAAGSGGGGGTFDPASYDWLIAADPATMTTSGGNVATIPPSFGATETLTAATTAPLALLGQGPDGQNMIRWGGNAFLNFTQVNPTAFVLCGYDSLHTVTGDNILAGYAAGTTNGVVRINSGGASFSIRRAGGAFATITPPHPPAIGRFYFWAFVAYLDGTCQVFLDGVGGNRVAVSGTTTRMERFGGANAMDGGPRFLMLGEPPVDFHTNMMAYFASWLPKTFYVNEATGDDNSVQPWKSSAPLKTLARACAFRAKAGDTFKCSGDFLGERLDPQYAGNATGGHITFEAVSGGKNWGGTLTQGGWAADGAGIGTRTWAYEPLAVWYHTPNGKTVHLVRRAGLGMDRSYEWISGTTQLRVRIDGQDFATSTASIRIADQTGTSFCSTSLAYIRAKGWDVRHRTNFGIQTFGNEFAFDDGKLCFNVNDGSGGGNSILRLNRTWVVGNGQRVWNGTGVVALDSEGDGISQHGSGEVYGTETIVVDSGFGGFQHQQSVKAGLTDGVLINNVRDTRISFNGTAGVGRLDIDGSLVLVGDRSEDGWGPYLGEGHPSASEMNLARSTIVCERANKTGTRGAYLPDGHGTANDNIFVDFETAVFANAGRAVTGTGNVATGTLKAGSDNSVAGLANTDPLFVNKAARNYALQAGSPAAGKGASAKALALMAQYLVSEFAA